MKQLVIIRGISGSGKTTMALKHFVPKGYIHVEADHYFYKDGVYTFDQSKLNDAHEAAMRKMENALEQGKKVVVSNTFLRPWEIKTYIDRCPIPRSQIEVIHAHGGTGDNKGLSDYVLEMQKNRIQPFRGEKKMKIDPATINFKTCKLISAE